MCVQCDNDSDGLQFFVDLVAGKDILPYLPQLMEFLINAVDHAPKLEAKALAISAIGATGKMSIHIC